MRFLALGEFDLSHNFLYLLAARGQDVAYGYLGKPRMPPPHPRLDVFTVPRRDRMPAVLERIASFRPEVLYVGSAGYDGSNALAADLIEARTGLPIVRAYKEFLIEASEREGRVLTRCDGVVLHSDAVSGYFRALYGLPPERVHVFDHDVIADHLMLDQLPEGTLNDEDGEPHVVLGGTMKSDGGGYDYREFVAALAAEGVHVHVYPVAYSRWLAPGRALDPDSAEVREAYEPLWTLPRVHLEEPLPNRDMNAVWARYDVGIMQVRPRTFLPAVTPWQQMDHPSKHTYYLTAGLPVAMDRAVLSSLRTKLEPYGVTIDYSDVRELAETLRDRAAVHAAARNVRAHRTEWPLGRGLPALLDFVERTCTAARLRAG